MKKLGTQSRIGPLKLSEERWRTSLCLPIRMLNELHDCLDREGTSRKRRSQWIENAIERLVLTEDFEVIVMEEFLEEGDNLTIPLTLNASLKSMLMNVIESSESRIETSSIVRAAISQRIMHHGGRDERRSA